MQWGFPIVSNNILQLYLAIGFPIFVFYAPFCHIHSKPRRPLNFPFSHCSPPPPPPHRTPPDRMDSKQSGIVV